MIDAPPPHDEEAEAAVLAAVMLAPVWVATLTTEVRLKAEHFYRPRHKLIFEAAVELDDNAQPVDMVTIANLLGEKLELAGGKDYIESLIGKSPSLGNTKKYGQIVKEKATLRRLLTATQEIQQRIANDSAAPKDVLENAYQLISEVGETEHQGAYTPDDLMDLAAHQLTDKPVERFPLILPKLNEWTNGGMARGQVMVVAAWPNTAKSVFVDQMAESMVKGTDRKACVYLTEMTVIERNARFIARNSKLTITEATIGNLNAEQMRRMGNYQPPPIHIQPAAGWTTDEICRDVLRKRWDVVVIDDIENLGYENPNQSKQEIKAEMSRRFNTLAKENQANCVLMMVSHLSRHGNKDEAPPRPKEAHLRDTQMLAARADICCMLYRDQDSEGTREAETEIYFTRNRGGFQGSSTYADFVWKHMRLDPKPEEMRF